MLSANGFFVKVTCVAVSQVGLEIQISCSHITLLLLQNHNIFNYLMVVGILLSTCGILPPQYCAHRNLLQLLFPLNHSVVAKL